MNLNLLEKLNEKQREAASQIDGSILILAGAGSGKTRTITYRIAHMIENIGISPYSILAVTFTNKAAKEMKERIYALVGETSKYIWINTFHSMCVRILRQHIELLGYNKNFTILDTSEQKSIIKTIVKNLNLSEDSYQPTNILKIISNAKNSLISVKKMREQSRFGFMKNVAEIYAHYQSYLKKNTKVYILFVVFIAIFFIMFYLYNLPLEALIYTGSFCFLAALVASFSDFVNYRESYKKLKFLEENILNDLDALPKSLDIRIDYYHKIIEKLYEELEKLTQENRQKNTDMVDYYSMWVHQIKTPIAAMNFLLDNEEVDQKILQQELFKIERYVEMVLTYIRLDSISSDYVITKINLDEVVKDSVKKYATIFINKKIKLNYVSHETMVISDKKWLSFAFEQILGNSVKYSSNGGEITIETCENKLIIEDNGMGIKEEDLPRIFEKGFTGFNGRYEKKSSGLGLYLCKKTLDKLGHHIEISSKVGEGTRIEITFPKEDTLRD